VLATEALNVLGGPNSFGATRHECGSMLDASSPGGQPELSDLLGGREIGRDHFRHKAWHRWFTSIKAIIVARPAIPYAARSGRVDLGSDDIPV